VSQFYTLSKPKFSFYIYIYVCVCERERESVCVCVCVFKRILSDLNELKSIKWVIFEEYFCLFTF
jgi:hypothetical protein